MRSTPIRARRVGSRARSRAELIIRNVHARVREAHASGWCRGRCEARVTRFDRARAPTRAPTRLYERARLTMCATRDDIHRPPSGNQDGYGSSGGRDPRDRRSGPPPHAHPYGRQGAPAAYGQGAPAPAQTAADLANLLRQVNEAMGGAVAQGMVGAPVVQQHMQGGQYGGPPGPPAQQPQTNSRGPTRVISGADPRARRTAAAGATASAMAPAQGQMFGTGPPAYGGAPRGGAPPPPPAMGQQYGAPPLQQYGAPPAQFGGPQHYGGPPGPPGPPVRGPGLGAASGPGWDGVGEQSVTEYIMCPNEHAGKVIGHGGEKINAIQTESGATVKIQNQSDVGPGQPRRVTITGPSDRVATASRMVYAIIESTTKRAPTSAPRQETNKAEILVPVQAADFGKIIGRGGETIRRLQEESGVRMQVDRPNSQVVISGDPSGCEVARTLLQEVIDAIPEPSSAGTTTEISAQGQEGRIIGKGGENIKSMAEQTGAKIVIVKETGMVRISGSPDNVQAAIDTVNAFIETQLNPVQRPGGGGGDSEYVPQHIGASEPSLIEYKPLWETHQSPEGYTYYYNTTTGETQWDEPPDFDGNL